MGAIIDLGKLSKVNMGIDLSGANIAMTEHLLYRAQITTAGEHMRGKAVTQQVRVEVLCDTGAFGCYF